MPYAKRDRGSLYYESAGAGDPPIVFIHGWCCDHTDFQPQFDHFRRSHRVIAPDLRGFGKSGVTDGAYTIESFADDAAWLCQHLAISKPVVIGHSSGGIVAIELAVRYPDLASAIIAVDPAPIECLSRNGRRRP